MDQDRTQQDHWSTQAQAGCGSCHREQGRQPGLLVSSAQRTREWASENLTLRVANSSTDPAAAARYHGNQAARAMEQFDYSFNQGKA